MEKGNNYISNTSELHRFYHHHLFLLLGSSTVINRWTLLPSTGKAQMFYEMTMATDYRPLDLLESFRKCDTVDQVIFLMHSCSLDCEQ